MPIKLGELAYYRSNVIEKYIIEIETMLKVEERKNKKNYEMYKRFQHLKADPNYKQCSCCKQYKRLTEFYKNPLKKQGVFDYCKECAKTKVKQRREYVKANRERERSIKNVRSAK